MIRTNSANGLPSIPGYELREKIGEGGMGEVYQAVQSSLQRPVAIKLLRPVSAGSTAIRQEARLMAALAHPHIVTIFDCGQVGNRDYLVMERVAGVPLRRRLESGKPWPVAKAAQVLDAIAQALCYIHDQGILHLDLKPENVLVADDGQVKITDFGLSVPAPDGQELAEGVLYQGSVDYCPPEQRFGLSLDVRCDVFALAVLAYELLTGALPGRVYVPASRRNRQVPKAVDAVLQRGLARNPKERYGSVAEFRRELSAALRSRRGRFARWAAAAALGVGLFALAWWVVATQGRPVAVNTTKERVAPAFAAAPFSPAEAKRFQQEWAEFLGVKPEVRNSIGMELVLVPPGKFLMGSKDEDLAERLAAHGPESRERILSETPAHAVQITRPFFLGKYEVTVVEFRRFVQARRYQTRAEAMGNAVGLTDKGWSGGPNFSWENQGRFRPDDDHPVSNVTWADAVEFCRWLSEKEGVTYRLPTEAEWEHACRSGSQQAWFFGDAKDSMDEYAWLSKNSGGLLHLVGQKKPNAFGLHDIYGNAFEWCSDWFASDYYRNSPVDDPPGPPRGDCRLVRGEAIFGGSFTLSAGRAWYYPDSAWHYIGFRVVKCCE